MGLGRREYLSSIVVVAPILGQSTRTYSEPTWEQGVYVSEQLYDRLGIAPAEAAEEHIDAAFYRMGIDVDVTVEEDPVEFETDDQNPICGSPAFDEWFNRSLPDRHSNICLLDSHAGGGCARIGPGGALASGSSLGEDTEHEWVRSWSRSGFEIHAILHEIAHNAGYLHEEPTGIVDEIGEEQHVTPATSTTVANEDAVCGGVHPEIIPDQQVFHHYYSACTERLFRETLEDHA